MIQIDGQSFDTEIEYFAFPRYHRIEDMDELAKLRLLSRVRSVNATALPEAPTDFGFQFCQRPTQSLSRRERVLPASPDRRS